MKLLKQKPEAMDFAWLPPAEEWDFRCVTKRECRVACHWEYSRQDRLSMPQLPNGQNHCPQNYRGAARELFPQLWTTLTIAQREQVLESFYPAPALQVHKLGEFLKRFTISGDSSEIPANFLEHDYVIIPSFTGRGVVAVTQQFGKWASDESKQYPPSPKPPANERTMFLMCATGAQGEATGAQLASTVKPSRSFMPTPPQSQRPLCRG